MYNVTFSPGETVASFAVQIIDDDLIEIDEILEFMIVADLLPDDVGSDNPNRAIINIVDDAGNGQFALYAVCMCDSQSLYVVSCSYIQYLSATQI